MRRIAPLLLLGMQAAWAQHIVGTRAGIVHFVTGQVLIDGQPAILTPSAFPLLSEGQVLQTGDGRAEILLGSGVFLRLGEHGAVRMLNTRLEDAQIELREGTALVEVVDMPRGSDVHVVVGPTRTGFKGMGLHRFEAGSGDLRVFGGYAEVLANGRKIEAGRGRAVHLGGNLAVTRFNPHRHDDLHEWAAERSLLLYFFNAQPWTTQNNWEMTRVTRGIQPAALPSDGDKWFVSNPDYGVMFPLPLSRNPHAVPEPKGATSQDRPAAQFAG